MYIMWDPMLGPGNKQNTRKPGYFHVRCVPYVNFLILIINLWLYNLLGLGQLGEEYP